MDEKYMTLAACEKTHKAIDEKFLDLKEEIREETTDRKIAITELKDEFKNTNQKIDDAVKKIEGHWFKNLFGLLKWAIITIISLCSFILYQFAIGKLKF